MLKKETVALIAKLTKTKVEDLEAAIKDEKEVDVVIDEKLTVLTEDETKTLKSNSYKEGKLAGVEMEVDEIKKEKGLEFTGKTVKGLVDAVAKKTLTDAKIDPDKKVTELEEKLKTVQQTATELQTKLTEKDAEVSSVKTQAMIVKDLPANTTLPADKILLLMKADGYDYKTEDGKIIWMKDGKAVTDKLGSNLDTKTIATEYVTANKLIATEDAGAGGRGGVDAGGSGKGGKLSDIKKKFEVEGKSLLGTEFSDAVAAAAKEDKDFDMNS